MSDELVHEFEQGAEKVGKALGEDVAHGLSGVYHETAENLHEVATNVEENEKKVVRKYFIDDDGSVKELRGGKLESIKADDKSGIRGILDKRRKPDAVKRLTKNERGKLSARDSKWKKLGRTEGKKGEWVESKKIDKPTELSRACEEARRARGDYGGNNYAALHYRSEDGNEEFILIGRSSSKRNDSERSIGYPMVHRGKQFQVDKIYTERRPCQENMNCRRWLNMHIFHPTENPHLEVTHGMEYDNAIENTEDRNIPFGNYISKLESGHATGKYANGLAGTMNFDN